MAQRSTNARVVLPHWLFRVLALVAATVAAYSSSFAGVVTGTPLLERLSAAGANTSTVMGMSHLDFLLTQTRVVATYLRLLVWPIAPSSSADRVNGYLISSGCVHRSPPSPRLS